MFFSDDSFYVSGFISLSFFLFVITESNALPPRFPSCPAVKHSERGCLVGYDMHASMGMKQQSLGRVGHQASTLEVLRQQCSLKKKKRKKRKINKEEENVA